MAERMDFDKDDENGFEIVPNTSSIKIQQTLKTNDDDYFETLSSNTKSSPLINTTNPVVEEPINQIVNEVKPSLSTNSIRLPLRYGSAAAIPYEEGFDSKSILNSKPILPSNDLMSLLQDDKLQKRPSFDNNLNELLLNHAQDRANLVQVARQIQQDFLDAIKLD